MDRTVAISRVARLDAVCAPFDWTWARENRGAIAANWAQRSADKPQMFNGRVLLVSRYEEAGETVRPTYFATDFADFLGWRDLGYPDDTIANGFAMAALQGSDGAYVCGVMGGGTANAGRVYFPSGTPDLSDLRPDGTVDLAGSVTRELAEETGLVPDPAAVADHWIVVRQWPAIAFLRPVVFAEPAEALAQRIRDAVAAQGEPELAGARVIRGPADIDEAAMPMFLRTFFRWAFAEQA
ncbi:MAG TPA: NUDIX hydrolase [Microvirga sp.]|jgi:8-oxo-dGTP pyrophosphatase MutT (NUDIX family)|nr:NUDIX hydrolase [Microvirga sp.]